MKLIWLIQGDPVKKKKQKSRRNKSMYRKYKIIGFRAMAQSAALPQKFLGVRVKTGLEPPDQASS